MPMLLIRNIAMNHGNCFPLAACHMPTAFQTASQIETTMIAAKNTGLHVAGSANNMFNISLAENSSYKKLHFANAFATINGNKIVASPNTFTERECGISLPHETASSGRAPASEPSNS